VLNINLLIKHLNIGNFIKTLYKNKFDLEFYVAKNIVEKLCYGIATLENWKV